MSNSLLSRIFCDSDGFLSLPTLSGVAIGVVGSGIAIYSYSSGSLHGIRPSVTAACCGLGIFIFTARNNQTGRNLKNDAEENMKRKIKKAYDLEIKRFCLKIIESVETLNSAFVEVPISRPLSINYLSTYKYLRRSMNKLEARLDQLCFWNEVENHSKTVPKEKRFFNRMDLKLLNELNNFVTSDHKLEGNDLVIHDTDVFENLMRLIENHRSKVKKGLKRKTKELSLRDLVVYKDPSLEPTAVRLDINKDSPTREMPSTSKLYPDSPGHFRDTYHPKHQRSSGKSRKRDETLSLDRQSSSKLYPDSPGTSRGVYYKVKNVISPKRSSLRHSSKKSKQSTKKSRHLSNPPSGSEDIPKKKVKFEEEMRARHIGQVLRNTADENEESIKSSKRGFLFTLNPFKSPKKVEKSPKKVEKSPKKVEKSPKKVEKKE